MKILPVSLIRDADAYTIKHEPIADIDLMERAAESCALWLQENINKDQKLICFCGSGNNGGDGLAIARLMFEAGYKVEAYTLCAPEQMSGNCRINYDRLREYGKKRRLTCSILQESGKFPLIDKYDIVIDAIFGSGLTRPAEGFAASVIHHINSGSADVISIDVPSGLFCDVTTRITPEPAVIHATDTYTFEPPKLAFFFPENAPFVGFWELLDIGIHPDFIDSANVQNFMVKEEEMALLLRQRAKFSHKGTYGHALIIAGSTGKMGAAVLSAQACLRSGPGLVTVHVPKSGVNILQTAFPEAMLTIDPAEDHFSAVPELAAYSAIAIGPGLGMNPQSANALKFLIQETKIPIIFDADAINILAENKTWLGFIPKGSIFTPHPKEFERLVGKSSNNFDQNQMQRDFSIKHQCYVILKGAHTAITTPDGLCYFNTTGNPGMATGGSGDVLTGIIAGLMAQGYSSLESCLFGVYIHGMAGDQVRWEKGDYALIASDIISNLGKSFQLLFRNNIHTIYGKF